MDFYGGDFYRSYKGKKPGLKNAYYVIHAKQQYKSKKYDMMFDPVTGYYYKVNKGTNTKKSTSPYNQFVKDNYNDAYNKVYLGNKEYYDSNGIKPHPSEVMVQLAHDWNVLKELNEQSKLKPILPPPGFQLAPLPSLVGITRGAPPLPSLVTLTSGSGRKTKRKNKSKSKSKKH